MSNEGYDSDNNQGDKPKDEFQFFATVFKGEEKKIINHARWEQVTAVYWQLLRTMPEQDSTKNTISQKQYTLLMKRIYKVLLPIYRENEVESELHHEWLLDSRGQPEISQVILGKILFRIAHWWSTNIDIDEYIDMLQRVYQRITYKRVYDVRNESQSDFFPQIQVGFPLEEKKINETVELNNQSNAQADSDWLECASNESNKSDFEYKYEEDPEKMVVKKLKKKKANAFDMTSTVAQTVKEPFIYNEEVLYPELTDPRTTELNYRSIEDKMLDIKQILPFGYPSEQFLRQTKQDVHNKIEEIKRNKKNSRQGNDDDEDQAVIPDPGLKPNENGIFLEFPINAWGVSGLTIFARVSDKLYNNYRKLLRDGVIMTLRFYSQFPKTGGRARTRSTSSKDEPNLELNKFGYNPSLDRRLSYKFLPVASKANDQQYINVNYLIADPDFETAYRSDVQRIETKGKMAIKESDEIKRDEEFVNVETPYKKVRQVMLQKKFETLFRDRAAAEQADQRRWQGVLEGIEKDKRAVLKHAPISQKGLRETYEEKSFVKMMRGPFCSLESREGPQEDDFYTCSDMDLINAARTQSLRLLVIGKPRSGKTKLSKNLAAKLDLVHISIDNWLAALQKKIKEYVPPEDLEEGKEAPKFLSDLEETVNKSLLAGSGPNDIQLLEIIKLQIQSPQAVLRGFVLDLSFYQRENSDQSWAGLIRQLKLLGETTTQKPVEFTHIIELWMEDDDIRLRSQNMRVDPADGVLYSRWEREERKKPKPKKEGEEEEPPADDENAVKPLVEKDLVVRVNDTEERIRAELTHFSSVERPAMEELLINFYEDQFIRLDAAGLTPDELTDAVQCRLKADEGLPLRPLPIRIEGQSEDAYLALLTDTAEDNNPSLPRKWSLWKQYDPVALMNGKLIKGKADYACHFAGNVFVFSSEENFNAFMLEPKKYLLEKPKMPDIFRVLMLGPRGAGKHTQAKLLSETYGWKVVDFKELVKNTLEELIKSEAHIPNNPMPGGRIGLSEAELNEVIEGKQFPAWKFIPWILNYLGCPLEKKRPPPPEEKPEGENPPEEEIDEETKKKRDQEAKKKAQEEEKKRKEEEEKNHAKEERRAKRQQARDQGLDPRDVGIEDSEEEPIIIEDLSIDQLVIKTDEATGKPHFVGGFILVGFPETLEHMEKLKAHGLQFDKIINVRDMSPLPEDSDELVDMKDKEQEPGTEIKARMAGVEFYDYDAEVEAATKIYGLAGESLGAEICCEIHCNGASEGVHIRVRKEIDPFFLKKDDPSVCKPDVAEGQRPPLPLGDFGEFCPVTYIDDGWLVKGLPENEIIVNGKSYLFADQNQAKRFSLNPSVYIKTLNGQAKIPLQPPKPKIMILGHRGAGTTGLIRSLCEKFKLEEFQLKKEFIKKQNEEKEKRKRARLLNKGFAPPAGFDEETGKAIPDPDVENEPESFNQEENDIEIMRSIMDANKGLIIDGNWRKLNEEDKMDGEEFQKLLVGSRRMPEIVVILKCSEDSTFKRVIDQQAIKAEYDRLMEIRNNERARVRAEERQKKESELIAENAEKAESGEQVDVNAALADWDKNRDDEEKAADEGDGEGVPKFNDMMDVQKAALTTQRTDEDAFFEVLSAEDTGLRKKTIVFVDDIKSDHSEQYVMIKILDRIKDNLQFRKDMIERKLAFSVPSEEYKDTKISMYEKSYQYKHSKFGVNSSLSLSNPAKSKKFAAVYRERIYFFSNQEEQQKFLKQPSKYTQEVSPIPLDVTIKPRVFVLGLPKSGKSTLCKILSEKIGVVHLKMNHIIQQFMSQDSSQGEQLRKHMKSEGRQLEDDMMVSLLIKRVQMKDCQLNGWVLEDFPKTRNQALFMAKRGIVPTNVFLMKQTIEETYKRTHARADQKFSCIRTIVAGRIKFFMEHLPHVTSFFQRFYNSLIEIDSNKSKWFIEDRALGEIQRNIESRQNFASDYYRHDQGHPVKMRDLHMDRCLVKQSLSEFRYYCPVTWKNEKLLVKCAENFEDCVLYNNAFYFFKSSKERDMFLSDFNRFTQDVNFPRGSELPLRAQPHKACEIILHEKSLSGHCAVSLTDEDRVRKGDPGLLILYKEDRYVFESEFKLQRFLANPFKYSKATLPVKMPPPEDKVSLYNLQKMEDSISFMEQALGQIVTKGLREVSENRLKYPTLSLKETMLKLFALFLKTENPANTESMKRKYAAKMKQFIQRCELPEEIYDLAMDKDKKKPKGQWPQFKENYYNDKGAEYDSILKLIEHERLENFINYIR